MSARSARQAGAYAGLGMIALLLVLYVISLSILHVVPPEFGAVSSPRVSDWHKHETKVSSANRSVGEAVAIPNPTPQEYSLSSRLNVDHIFRFDSGTGCSWGLTPGTCGFWVYKSGSSIRLAKREVVPWREISDSTDFALRIMYSVGGKVPIIAPNWSKAPRHIFAAGDGLEQRVISLAKNVGAVSGDHRLLGNLGGASGSSVGANEKEDLNTRYNSQDARKYHEPESVIRDSLIRFPFGAFWIGVGIGIAYCGGCIALWWRGRRR